VTTGSVAAPVEASRLPRPVESASGLGSESVLRRLSGEKTAVIFLSISIVEVQMAIDSSRATLDLFFFASALTLSGLSFPSFLRPPATAHSESLKRPMPPAP